jgi:hypothetical protein
LDELFVGRRDGLLNAGVHISPQEIWR